MPEHRGPSCFFCENTHLIGILGSRTPNYPFLAFLENPKKNARPSPMLCFLVGILGPFFGKNPQICVFRVFRKNGQKRKVKKCFHTQSPRIGPKSGQKKCEKSAFGVFSKQGSQLVSPTNRVFFRAFFAFFFYKKTPKNAFPSWFPRLKTRKTKKTRFFAKNAFFGRFWPFFGRFWPFQILFKVHFPQYFFSKIIFFHLISALCRAFRMKRKRP